MATGMTETGRFNDEALVPYWDPRYHQFFFSGLLPPPSGDPRLEAVYASPSVEVYPDEPYKENSILSTPGKRRNPDHGTKRRRVSWSAFLPQRHENKGFWRTIPFLVCMAILLCIFFLMISYWLWDYMNREDAPEETELEGSDPQLDVGTAVKPFFPREDVVTEILMVPPLSNAKDLLRGAKQKGLESVDSFQNSLRICGDRQDRDHPVATGIGLSPPTPHCCDETLVCLYTVQGKVVSHATTDANSSCSLKGFRPLRTACSDGRLPKPLLGVQVSDIGLGSEDATTFLSDAVSAAKRGGFQGIALWWRHDWKYDDEMVVNACRAAAEELLRSKLAFSFLLPYPSTTSRRLARLEESLHAWPYSIVFYPHVSMFGRKAAWPAPRDVVLKPSNGVRSRGRRVCYVFTTTSFWARLKGKCDLGKVQETADPLMPASDKACRSLWSNSSEVVSRRYYTLRCRGSSGVLYQTAAQAARFRRSVLSLAGTSCHGTVDGWRREWQPVCVNFSTTYRD